MYGSVVAIAVDGEGGDGATRLCGLDEATLRRVVALTLAHAGVMQPVELSVLVTDDQTLRRLNREYRGHDEVTDVLSFPQLVVPLVRAPAEQLWDLPDPVPSGPPPASTAPTSARDVLASHSVVSYDEEGEESADEAVQPPAAFVALAELQPHLGDIAVARQTASRQAVLAGHSPAWELAYLVAHGVLHLVGYDDHTEAGYAAMAAHQEAVLRESGIAG